MFNELEKYNGILVKDTKKALKQIAKFSRYRFKGTTIALTGSSGKTSTKHLLASSLKRFRASVESGFDSSFCELALKKMSSQRRNWFGCPFEN